jgi:hypothetical protein
MHCRSISSEEQEERGVGLDYNRDKACLNIVRNHNEKYKIRLLDPQLIRQLYQPHNPAMQLQ